MATRVATIGQVLKLEVDGFGHDGQGVGRWQDTAVFVAGALPGETITVRVRRLARRHLEAELVGVDTPSPQPRTRSRQTWFSRLYAASVNWTLLLTRSGVRQRHWAIATVP